MKAPQAPQICRKPNYDTATLTGEDRGGGEKKINITPHPNPLPQGER
jgi:hypothetical protein